MNRRALIVLAVVGLVMFAGCASLISSREEGGTTTTVETTTQAAETTAETTETTTEDAETTTEDTETTTEDTEETTTTTTSESWSSPEETNKPLQKKYRDESEERIKSIEVGGEGSSEEGYSSVDVTVTANTAMPNVDPEDHGDVEGEPFIIIFINGHLATSDDTEFATPRGVRVARTPELDYDENGEFTLTVPKEAFEAAGVESGEDAELMVMLMDRDEEWDDIYGIEFVNVTYNADA